MNYHFALDVNWFELQIIAWSVLIVRRIDHDTSWKITCWYANQQAFIVTQNFIRAILIRCTLLLMMMNMFYEHGWFHEDIGLPKRS